MLMECLRPKKPVGSSIRFTASAEKRSEPHGASTEPIVTVVNAGQSGAIACVVAANRSEPHGASSDPVVGTHASGAIAVVAANRPEPNGAGSDPCAI